MVADLKRKNKVKYKEHPTRKFGKDRVCLHTGKQFNRTWSAIKLYDSCEHCNSKEIGGLHEYYEIKDNGKDWHLHCKKCRKGFALAKGALHIGNHLSLLNHTRSHD